MSAVAAMALPAAARDSYSLSGPIEIRLVGAAGQARDFLVVSSEDGRAASSLLEQVRAHGLQPPAEPIAEMAWSLPHYQLGIGQLGPNNGVIWPRLPETTFVYYPGGAGKSFLMLDSHGRNLQTDGWWLETSPDVAAMLQRHLGGLAPIGSAVGVVPTSPASPTSPWGLVLGGTVLSGLSLMLIEDRRRWRAKVRSADPKGT
jgi:hypothetical protein